MGIGALRIRLSERAQTTCHKVKCVGVDPEVPWRQQMKNAIVCLSAMLMCSCHQGAAGSLSGHRRTELSKIMSEYFQHGNPYPTNERYTFEFRGPFTIEQVEQESLEEVKRAPRNDVPLVPFGFSNHYWVGLKRKYKDGDELYFFLATATPSYSQSAGYVLIRGKEVLGGVTSWMN